MEYQSLLNWIDPKKLNWSGLSSNPNPIAIHILSQNLEKIDNFSLTINRNIKEFPNKKYLNKIIMNDIYGTLMDNLSLYSNDIAFLEANIEKINWGNLSKNPNAIELLKKYPTKIDWIYLSHNPNAMELIEMNLEKISWYNLSQNPNAIEILRANPKRIHLRCLSGNPNAIEILKEKIHWKCLSANPNAIKLLREYPDMIDWKTLLSNSNAIELLCDNQTKIKWSIMCNIHKKEAIELIKNNLNKKYYKYLDWSALSSNPFAIELLKENPEMIDWWNLSSNPSIFQYNYQEMKENKQDFTNEIVEIALNPVRINDLMMKYGRDIVYNSYF